MKIGCHDINEKVMIIAEIGNNHEGDFDRAVEMIRRAAESGAHAVKFQTIVPDRLVSVSDTARIDQLSKFQFSYEQFAQLAAEARRQNVIFLSTPFDLDSVEALNPLVPAFKIASSDNDFYPLVEAIAGTGKPVLMSTGLADLTQIKATVGRIKHVWAKNGVGQEMAVLHCVTSYPTSPQEANIAAVKTLQKEIGGVVGYSDHTLGIEAALLAVGLGARIIEKHFTLDKNLSDFRDHQLSADPAELRELVEKTERIQTLLGDGTLDPRASESEVIGKVRRSIVAKRDMSAGTAIGHDDISWVRPGGGLAPGNEDKVLGKILSKALPKGGQIRLNDLKG